MVRETGAIPQFGKWNEEDPSAGEGFTAVFDKARDEKKAGGAAVLQQGPARVQSGDKPQVEKPSKFRLCGCCFGPSNAD